MHGAFNFSSTSIPLLSILFFALVDVDMTNPLSFAHRQPGSHHVSSNDTHHSLVKITSPATPETQEVFHNIVEGRKSWKSSGGQVVWPPLLESALLEGLESYQPEDSRVTRILGRFPLRNKFISDFIFERTGKRRTARQVGSRLQQLRDTCGGKKLLSLLTPCPKPGVRPSTHSYRRYGRDSSSSRGTSSPTSCPTSPLASPSPSDLTFPEPVSPVIYISILPPTFQESSSVDSYSLSSSIPRFLSQIDPTVTFTAPHSLLNATAKCTVSFDGVVVHVERTYLISRILNSATPGPFLYSTSLAVSYWKTISESPDPTQYTILLQVGKDGSSNTIDYSAVFKFCYPSFSSPDSNVSADPFSVSVTSECRAPSSEDILDGWDMISVIPSGNLGYPTTHSISAWGISPPRQTSSTSFPLELSNYVS
ncbi:hypothetical protein C8J56DRAFT_536307 [Mycena floridula]|nr:hypothetical protein C8J56DRAFT_536307 [Mycena floridula]